MAVRPNTNDRGKSWDWIKERQRHAQKNHEVSCKYETIIERPTCKVPDRFSTPYRYRYRQIDIDMDMDVDVDVDMDIDMDVDIDIDVDIDVDA